MTDQPRPSQLPHHRLVAYQVAVELLLAIKAAEIRDATLRDQGLRAASPVARASRPTGPSKRQGSPEKWTQRTSTGVTPLAKRLYALLTGLLR
jgi:hypothetical protein